MRALIVEDDVALSRLLSRCLTQWGWLADEASRVSTALDSFTQWSHDLLLCGVELPDGDGVSLAQELLKVKPTLIVILISGAPENLERAREVGLTACLHEPFALDDLRALVEVELRRREKIDRQFLA